LSRTSEEVRGLVAVATANSLAAISVASTEVSPLGAGITDSVMGFASAVTVAWLAAGAASAFSFTVDKSVDAGNS